MLEPNDSLGKLIVVWEPVLRRFSLLGEGETGSPRSRFLARVTAVEGAGSAGALGGDKRELIDGLLDEALGRDLDGLAKGLNTGCGMRALGFSRSFPLAFWGEKGLNEVTGAAAVATRELRATKPAWS